MRAPRTLFAYVAKEVALYSALGLLTITMVLVSRNLLRFLDEWIAAGFVAAELGALLAYLFGILAPYVLPIAFLFGALLAVGRLAGDAEITAMRSCGMGLRQIATPVVAVGAAVSALTWFITLRVEHEAHHELRMLVKELATRGVMVRPGEFREVDDRVLYARARDAGHRLRGVMIADRSDPAHPFTIFAESGELVLDEQLGALLFRLEQGDIHAAVGGTDGPDDPGDRHRRISFEHFDYAFESRKLLGTNFTSLRPREMSIEQLREVVARADAGDDLSDLRRSDPAHYHLHIHRRLALPFAPLLFGLLAVPLGAQRVRGGRARGVVLCVVICFGYYVLLTASQSLVLRGRAPANVALWLPNLVFAGAAAVLLLRARRAVG